MNVTDMGSVYDGFAEKFSKTDRLPSWMYVGKPAMEKLFAPFDIPSAKIVDLGSASARVEQGVLLPLGARAENIVGIEISPEQVEIAHQRIPDATFVVGDVSDSSVLGEMNGTFDVAFSHMVFEHLNDDQLSRTYANAYRLLKPGGAFVFVVTHPDKMTDLDGNSVTTYGHFQTTAPWGGVLDNWRRPVSETLGLLESAGFTGVTYEELLFPSEPPAGLSQEDLDEFETARAKYEHHPAIRLSVSAQKPA